MSPQFFEHLEQLGICVLIPTYNNAGTLERVLEGVLSMVPDERVLVINDGSTDTTAEILDRYAARVEVITHPVNKGKGRALRTGFSQAIQKGFRYALTIDSDGQHYPEDIPVLVEALVQNPGACIMGARNMEQEGVPQKSSFGNKFSNFWFMVETGCRLPDTQTGYRIYPLETVKKMQLFTSKFELEIEVIVKLAWRFVPFVAVPVRVKYDPDERVSHFRPFQDFFRISVLNTCLVLLALVWYYPRLFFSRKTLAAIRREAIKPEESNLRKAASLGFGVFMGIVPIWGFQLLIGIPLSIVFRLNKVLFIAAANISIPPMIPVLLYISFVCGQLLMNGAIDNSKLVNLSLDVISENLVDYLVGACVFAVIAGLSTFGISYGLLSLFRKNRKPA